MNLRPEVHDPTTPSDFRWVGAQNSNLLQWVSNTDIGRLNKFEFRAPTRRKSDGVVWSCTPGLSVYRFLECTERMHVLIDTLDRFIGGRFGYLAISARTAAHIQCTRDANSSSTCLLTTAAWRTFDPTYRLAAHLLQFFSKLLPDNKEVFINNVIIGFLNKQTPLRPPPHFIICHHLAYSLSRLPKWWLPLLTTPNQH